MGKQRFRCVACKKLRPLRVKGQRYCGQKACQQARKSAWNNKKYSSDVDYRNNQKQSTKSWLESVGGAARYHRNYRKKRKQKVNVSLFANKTNKANTNANMDALLDKSPVKTGRYLLFPVDSANMDALLVNIADISMAYDYFTNKDMLDKTYGSG